VQLLARFVTLFRLRIASLRKNSLSCFSC